MDGLVSWGVAPGWLGVAPLALGMRDPWVVRSALKMCDAAMSSLRTASIPHISFIERYIVAFEECPVFLLKGFRPVVFALVGDVLADGFNIGF